MNDKQVLYPTKSMATPKVYHFFIRLRAQYKCDEMKGAR